MLNAHRRASSIRPAARRDRALAAACRCRALRRRLQLGGGFAAISKTTQHGYVVSPERARAGPGRLEPRPGADRARLALDHRQLRRRGLLLHQPDAPARRSPSCRTRSSTSACVAVYFDEKRPVDADRQLRHEGRQGLRLRQRARRRPAARTRTSCQQVLAGAVGSAATRSSRLARRDREAKKPRGSLRRGFCFAVRLRVLSAPAPPAAAAPRCW